MSSKLSEASPICFESVNDKSPKIEVHSTPKEEKGIPFFNGNFVIRVANRLELREKAYELLYHNWAQMGITRVESDGLWLSIYDALPETTTFLAEDRTGQIIGALTLVFDSAIDLPADELYKEELNRFRENGRNISEIMSLGIRKDARPAITVLAGMFYCAYLFAWHIKKSTDFVIMINPRHEKVYCHKLLFSKIGPKRTLGKVNGLPALLLNLPLKLPEKITDNRRVFPVNYLNFSDLKKSGTAKSLNNMKNPMSDEEFYVFFIEKSNVWEKSSAEQRDYIKSLYPASQVDHFKISRSLARGVSKKLQDKDDTQKFDSKVRQA